VNRTDDLVEVICGVAVPDPYRWLEDGDDPAVRAWVAAQNARTRSALDALPFRAGLRRRLVDLLGAPTSVAPAVGGDLVFTLDRAGDREQAVLTARHADHRGVPPRVLVDPAAGGDPTAAIDWFHPSPDGRFVAYGLSLAGDERSTLHVVDVADPASSPADRIPDTRAATVAWLPDATAFAYTRYPPGDDYGRAVRFHRLGADPATDPVVYAPDDPTAWPDVDISPDGRFLVVHVSFGWTRTDVFLVDRRSGARRAVIDGADAVTNVVVVGDRIYGVTNLDAPCGRVVTATVDDPARWTTIVPEGEEVVEAVVVAGGSLLVASMREGAARLVQRRLDGTEAREVRLPDLGSLAGLDADPRRERAFFSFTTFSRPPELWRWSPDRGPERWSDGEPPFDPSDYVTERFHYPSTDGTPIPGFYVRHRGTVPGPRTPTVLTGYGGFALASSPAYGPGIPAWCDAGGAYVVVGIRGGNEYGEAWHRAGMLHGKQQVFDDFAAGARWLVDTGRTSPGRLAIRGGSNGGLLVAVTITQRPDLCRAAVCAVPLTDMLRYHRSGLGALWVPEYGDPENCEHFRFLHAYSPYHHVDPGVAYPATLVLTAEEDTRVDPMHARKFAARLQDASAVADLAPVLLRVEPRAGHGVGKPLSKQAEELADAWSFCFWQLGVRP
jgi:prolyl oligopeptidase